MQLPPDVPPGRYAAVVQAVVGVLAAADVLSGSSVVVDDLARDEDLNDAFDQFSALYPWSQC
ncbi:hypothetical protein ACFPN7_29980 [Amycolatopsis halotolerans]|uniref:hypothetical protein n=1 Tax=Amycolatopsis halotolerans TaxID=330083 RepID=UPI00360AA693